jgi:hypothetical protein
MACVICEHPKCAEITAATADGSIPRTLPARYGVKKVEIARHLGHTPRQPVERPAEVSSPMNPRTTLSLRHAMPARRELTPSEPDSCPCDWCRLSGYRRLARAWDEATEAERERFCAETQTPEWV